MRPDAPEALERFHRLLVREIRAREPELLERPFAVAQIYQELLPYRTHRAELGVAMNADYEHVLMRFLAGEGDLVELETPAARTALERELDRRNPDTSLYRQFAAVGLRLLRVPKPPADSAAPGGVEPALQGDPAVPSGNPDARTREGPSASEGAGEAPGPSEAGAGGGSAAIEADEGVRPTSAEPRSAPGSGSGPRTADSSEGPTSTFPAEPGRAGPDCGMPPDREPRALPEVWTRTDTGVGRGTGMQPNVGGPEGASAVRAAHDAGRAGSGDASVVRRDHAPTVGRTGRTSTDGTSADAARSPDAVRTDPEARAGLAERVGALEDENRRLKILLADRLLELHRLHERLGRDDE